MPDTDYFDDVYSAFRALEATATPAQKVLLKDLFKAIERADKKLVLDPLYAKIQKLLTEASKP